MQNVKTVIGFSPLFSKRTMKSFRSIVSVLFAISIAGCNDQYWRRSDSIYLNHGDAVRSNIAVQVQDPWPKGSENNNIPMDPVKAQTAIECYRQGAHAGDPLGSESMGFKSTAGGSAGGGGGASSSTCQAGHPGHDDSFTEPNNRRRNKGNSNSRLPEDDPWMNEIPNPNENRNAIVNPHTGEVLTPAGPNYIGTRDGTLYIPTGPGGPLLNTRTGRTGM